MIYEYFLQKVGTQNLVNMFTNITNGATKKYIISQFCSRENQVRVVVATLASGIGINCPYVSKINHFRSPSSLLDYG